MLLVNRTIELEIPAGMVEISPASRPKITVVRGRGMAYDTATYKAFKASMEAWKLQRSYKDLSSECEYMHVDIEFIFGVTESWSKREKARCYGQPCISKSKGDIDNLFKAYTDALFSCDERIVKTTCSKRWVVEGEVSRVVIKVRFFNLPAIIEYGSAGEHCNIGESFNIFNIDKTKDDDAIGVNPEARS